MNIFTGRNEVVAKVIFLHLSVILFTRGGLPQCMVRYPPPSRSRHPPGADTPPEQTPPRSRHPPEQTPPRSRHPHGSRHPLPQEQTPPPRSRHPPRADTPHPGSRLQHTVYERPVRILLECILVLWSFYRNAVHEISHRKWQIHLVKPKF